MRATPEDLALFSSCFEKNSTARNADVLEWQYLRNPTGRLFVDFATDPDGRVAAIYATLPVRMRVAGSIRLGVQSVDTITDTEFRGRGLFLKLAATTYERATAHGATVVYGFPNGNSAHGFFKRLDWTSLDPVPFLIRPLRAAYVLERLKLQGLAHLVPNVPLVRPRIRRREVGEPISRFDERFDEFWSETARNAGVAVERDAAYMNWRLQKPGERYVNRGIFEGDRLVAFVSYTVKSKHGGSIGYVMEALCRSGHHRRLRTLLRHALHDMADAGADVALAWCLSHSTSYSSYLRSGFLPFPERMRPIELHFGARELVADAENCRQRGSWYLSYLDSDTV